VSGGGEILLLGEPSVGEEFAARCGDGARVTRLSDPYDALEEMSRRPWPVVVLTAPRPELDSLCRASRRLQCDARLLAICSPADEPDVRKLSPGVLDDYFVYPPTRGDWQDILQAARGAPSGGAVVAGLSAKDIGELFAAAESVQGLEDRVAAMVGERLGCEVRWAEARDAAGGATVLLTAAGDQPRALVAEDAGQAAAADPSAQAFLKSLRDILPAMLAAAERCESLNRLAITDHLTGAYNRRYFYMATDRILKRAEAEGFRATLLLYDIDDFKRYNDTYGHAAGDEILRETAAMMRRITRTQDIVARIGGDEFAVLFWDAEPPRSPGSTPPQRAYDLADRFRQAVTRMNFHSLGPEARGSLTISGGLASFPEAGGTCRELLRAADRALKSAKQSGKDAIKLIGAD